MFFVRSPPFFLLLLPPFPPHRSRIARLLFLLLSSYHYTQPSRLCFHPLVTRLHTFLSLSKNTVFSLLPPCFVFSLYPPPLPFPRDFPYSSSIFGARK